MQKALNIASAETLALKKNTDSGFFFNFTYTIWNDRAGYRCLPETKPMYFVSQIINSFLLQNSVG